MLEKEAVDVEVDEVTAAVMKGLLSEGYNGQQVAQFFGVNSRVTSQIKNGKAYEDLPPEKQHGISNAAMMLSKHDLHRVLGDEVFKRVAALLMDQGLLSVDVEVKLRELEE